jgi:RecB family exonuclease
MRWSPSRLSKVLSCPTWHEADREAGSVLGHPAGALGTEVHRALEVTGWAALNNPLEAPDIYDCAKEARSVEAKAAILNFRPWFEMDRIVSVEQDLSTTIGPHELSAVLDRVDHFPGEVASGRALEVIDYKTGRTRVGDISWDSQAIAQGVLALEAYPDVEMVKVVFAFLVLGYAKSMTIRRSQLPTYRRVLADRMTLAERLTGARSRLPGSHCRFCPLLSTCDGPQRLVEAFGDSTPVLGDLSRMGDEAAEKFGRKHQRIKAVAKVADALAKESSAALVARLSKGESRKERVGAVILSATKQVRRTYDVDVDSLAVIAGQVDLHEPGKWARSATKVDSAKLKEMVDAQPPAKRDALLRRLARFENVSATIFGSVSEAPSGITGDLKVKIALEGLGLTAAEARVALEVWPGGVIPPDAEEESLTAIKGVGGMKAKKILAKLRRVGVVT